jgi:hypothetical protein
MIMVEDRSGKELDFQSVLKEYLHPPADEKKDVEREPLGEICL